MWVTAKLSDGTKRTLDVPRADSLTDACIEAMSALASRGIDIAGATFAPAAPDEVQTIGAESASL